MTPRHIVAEKSGHHPQNDFGAVRGVKKNASFKLVHSNQAEIMEFAIFMDVFQNLIIFHIWNTIFKFENIHNHISKKYYGDIIQ